LFCSGWQGVTTDQGLGRKAISLDDYKSWSNAYIDDILSILALYPTSALGLIKQLNNVASKPNPVDTVGDATRFLQATSQPAAQVLMADFLELTRNQSAGDVELYLGKSVSSLYK